MAPTTTNVTTPALALALVFAGCVLPPYEVGGTTTGTATETGGGGSGGREEAPDLDEPGDAGGGGAGGDTCSLTVCGAACVDLARDRANCGACSNACPFGPCMEGKCVDCLEHDLADCGDACADLTTSEDHCGACGNPCPGGCQDGSCVTGLKRAEP